MDGNVFKANFSLAEAKGKIMASAEVNSRPQPLFWRHVALWLSSIPRSALLSMVGPLLLCVFGYVGWRFYGAPRLDMAYYGLKKENIHVPAQLKWMRETNVLDEVFDQSNLSNMSLLDSQTPVVLARLFNAHPCVRRTLRVERLAGQIMINLEYREPVAMVCCMVRNEATGQENAQFLPVDVESVLLNTKNFTSSDVPQYIAIHTDNQTLTGKLVEGKPFGDSRIEEAVKLCWLLQRFREAVKITGVYVYKAPRVGKSRWWLEIETSSGPRFEWGSAPGMEGLEEPTAETKLNQLLAAAKDSKQWSQANIVLSGQSRSNLK